MNLEQVIQNIKEKNNQDLWEVAKTAEISSQALKQMIKDDEIKKKAARNIASEYDLTNEELEALVNLSEKALKALMCKCGSKEFFRSISGSVNQCRICDRVYNENAQQIDPKTKKIINS